MDASEYVFTLPKLQRRYHAPYTAIRKVADNLDLGSKLGRWRLLSVADLVPLELALKAMGYSLPANLPSVEELAAIEEGSQPAVEAEEVTS
jgi:hypothetical protein